MIKPLTAALYLTVASVSVQAQSGCPAVFKSQALEPLMGGKPVALCQHAGKAVLIVNTASKCGFTQQYEGLEKLHRTYGTRGLVVMGVPANDFGAQEPGSNQQIADFCQANFGVSFFMASKLDQPIPQTPLFVNLSRAANAAQPALPKWNFHKYLVAPSGQVQSFGSSVEPLSPMLVKAVEAALPARQ